MMYLKHLTAIIATLMASNVMAANYLLVKPVSTLVPSDKGSISSGSQSSGGSSIPGTGGGVTSPMPRITSNISSDTLLAEFGETVIKTYTFTNNGNVPLTALTIKGTHITPIDCGVSLAVGASCVISYTPDTYSAGVHEHSITVEGTAGSTTVAATVNITTTVSAQLSGLTIDTENVTLAGDIGTSDSRILTITNPNEKAVNVLAINFPVGTISNNSCGSTIAANSNCSFTISKQFETEGTVNSQLEVVYAVNLDTQVISIPVAVAGIDNWQIQTSNVLPSAKLATPYNFDLNTRIDSASTPSSALWRITGGSLPAGMQLNNNLLQGTPTVGGGFSLTFNVDYKGKTITKSYNGYVDYPMSCKDLLQTDPNTPSGNYMLDVDGRGGSAPMSYYCDMVSSGGGWTQVVRQTEAQPVTSWNGGVNGSSYTLAQQLIPAHTQIGIGKDNQATFVDYVNGTYQATDMNGAVTLTSPQTGFQYQMHHKVGTFYRFNNPEEAFYNYPDNSNPFGDGDWRNALTFDRVGDRAFTWSFAPAHANPSARGFGMAGTAEAGNANSYAWTVWVR